MRVIGATMVRNESDIIAQTLLHQLGQGLDQVYVLDRGSDDGTVKIVAELAELLPGRIVLLVDSQPGYHQAQMMTNLAHAALAGQDGRPFWLVPFDADEFWWSHRGTLAEMLRAVSPGVRAVRATMHNYRTTAVDPVSDLVSEVMVWRERQPNGLPKAAVLWDAQCTLHQGNHGANRRDHELTLAGGHGLRVSHFQYRSAGQFVNKVLGGAASYLAEPDGGNPNHGAHWRTYRELVDRLGKGALFEVYRQHFHHLSPTDAGLVLDPSPYTPAV